MDGINDEEDQDDDNDGIDDDGKPQLSSYIKWLINDFKEDSDDDGDGIDDEEEDEDNDGIPNGGLLSSLKLTWMLKLWFFPPEDSDDDGDGISDELDDDGKAEPPAKTKGKGSSGSGPWGSLVFGYYFGLTQYILKTA